MNLVHAHDNLPCIPNLPFTGITAERFIWQAAHYRNTGLLLKRFPHNLI
jgi:hypothetical protein